MSRADDDTPRVRLVVKDLAPEPPAAGKAEKQATSAPARAQANRLNLDPEKTRDGVAQLVLTLIQFLHDLLDRQAVRRMDAGTLTPEEIERLGVALLKQEEQIERLCKEFGLEKEDLNLDLGPLGKLI